MKKILLGLGTLLILNMNSVGQLSGTYHIPDYTGPGFPSVYNAVLALNSQGISGNVTFLVAAGFNESTEVPIILTATGYPGSEIVFQKNGSGPNPKVTRADGGSLVTSAFGGQGDAVIIIQGSDFVTFDGIDVAATNQGIEYGYYLRKASGINGCKFVSIVNSTITLTKGTSPYVIGIYSSNNSSASPVNASEGIEITSIDGRHEVVKICGNTIQNVFCGIVLRGYNQTTSPYDFYDKSFDIGANEYGNTIQNFAGYSTSQWAYGIYIIHHNDINVSHNTINNLAAGGSPFTWTGFGIYHGTSTDAIATYEYNNINLSSSGNNVYAIYFGTPGTGQYTINSNSLTLSQTATAAATHINVV
ncbi:MAG: hypothetical protein K0B15_17295 [Lentimicrobium sp.]|nr:hypothetical protein [Lentimicrobium sp.]